MGMSLSTLDRRITAGQLMARREARGQRHRVYVVVEDNSSVTNGAINALVDTGFGNSQLAVARERIRGLEAQVELLQEQLRWEQERNVELFYELKQERLRTSGKERKNAWWKFWQRRCPGTA